MQCGWRAESAWTMEWRLGGREEAGRGLWRLGGSEEAGRAIWVEATKRPQSGWGGGDLTLSSLKDAGSEFPHTVDFKPSSPGTRWRQKAGSC